MTISQSFKFHQSSCYTFILQAAIRIKIRAASVPTHTRESLCSTSLQSTQRAEPLFPFYNLYLSGSQQQPCPKSVPKIGEILDTLLLSALDQCFIPPERHDPQLIFHIRQHPAHVSGNCLVQNFQIKLPVATSFPKPYLTSTTNLFAAGRLHEMQYYVSLSRVTVTFTRVYYRGITLYAATLTTPSFRLNTLFQEAFPL